MLHFLAYRLEAAFKKTPSFGDGQRLLTCQILQKIANGPISGKDDFFKNVFSPTGKKNEVPDITTMVNVTFQELLDKFYNFWNAKSVPFKIRRSHINKLHKHFIPDLHRALTRNWCFRRKRNGTEEDSRAPVTYKFEVRNNN